MLQAGKIMALAAIYAMEDPEMMAKAKAELEEKRGGKYICPVGKEAKPRI